MVLPLTHRRTVAPRVSGRRQRGAALVEFAIVMPLLFTLLFGIVDFGLTFNDSLSLRQGVREGARQASVANYDTCGTAMCTTYNRIGLDASVKIKVALPNGTFAKGDPVLVCAQKPLTSVTGLFGPILNGKYLKSKVQMRIEKAPTASPVGQDTAVGGWSWCT